MPSFSRMPSRPSSSRSMTRLLLEDVSPYFMRDKRTSFPGRYSHQREKDHEQNRVPWFFLNQLAPLHSLISEAGIPSTPSHGLALSVPLPELPPDRRLPCQRMPSARPSRASRASGSFPSDQVEEHRAKKYGDACRLGFGEPKPTDLHEPPRVVPE